jgi:NAD kinase
MNKTITKNSHSNNTPTTQKKSLQIPAKPNKPLKTKKTKSHFFHSQKRNFSTQTQTGSYSDFNSDDGDDLAPIPQHILAEQGKLSTAQVQANLAHKSPHKKTLQPLCPPAPDPNSIKTYSYQLTQTDPDLIGSLNGHNNTNHAHNHSQIQYPPHYPIVPSTDRYQLSPDASSLHTPAHTEYNVDNIANPPGFNAMFPQGYQFPLQPPHQSPQALPHIHHRNIFHNVTSVPPPQTFLQQPQPHLHVSEAESTVKQLDPKEQYNTYLHEDNSPIFNKKQIRSVLLVKKWQSKQATLYSNHIAEYLTSKNIQVFVEPTSIQDYTHDYPTIFDLMHQVDVDMWKRIPESFPTFQETILSSKSGSFVHRLHDEYDEPVPSSDCGFDECQFSLDLGNQYNQPHSSGQTNPSNQPSQPNQPNHPHNNPHKHRNKETPHYSPKIAEKLHQIGSRTFWQDFSRSDPLKPSFSPLEPRECIPFQRKYEKWQEFIDVVIAVGGDGTLLHVSTLFGHQVPPVLGFSCGSFGFLMPFNPDRAEQAIDKLLDGKMRYQNRSRIFFKVHPTNDINATPNPNDMVVSIGKDDNGSTVPSVQNQEKTQQKQHAVPPPPQQLQQTPKLPQQQNPHTPNASPIPTINTNGTSQTSATPLFPINQYDPDCFHLLNEIVLKHSYTLNSSASVCDIECRVNGHTLARFQGDGLILASPTGSTAYSLAAGGSIIHPSLNCLLITPIAPMTLSSRPVIIPSDSIVTLSPVSTPVLLEGKYGRVVYPGESIVITASKFPLPVFCRRDATSDFMQDLGSRMNYARMFRFKRQDDDVTDIPQGEQGMFLSKRQLF